MSWIVLVRLQDGRLEAIVEDDAGHDLKEWPDEKSAFDGMRDHILFSHSWEPIEVTV